MYILLFVGGGGGSLIFFREETGRVKTDLGKCNLKVTRPDGTCSKILVSNPVPCAHFFCLKNSVINKSSVVEHFFAAFKDIYTKR